MGDINDRSSSMAADATPTVASISKTSAGNIEANRSASEKQPLRAPNQYHADSPTHRQAMDECHAAKRAPTLDLRRDLRICGAPANP